MPFSTTPGEEGYVSSGWSGVAGVPTSLRKYSLADKIIFQEPQNGKLHALLREFLKVVKVDDPEPKTILRRDEPRSFTCSGDSSTTTNSHDTLQMEDTQAKWLQVGDKLEVANIFCDEDGSNYTTTKFGNGYRPEVIIVKSVTLSGISSGTAKILVKRGNGNEPSAGVQTITSSMKLTYLGNAMEAGGNAIVPKSAESETDQNYCEIFSKTWGDNETAQNMKAYGRLSMEQKAIRARRNILEDIDYALLWGRKSKDSIGNDTRWFTGGIVEYIPDASDALDSESRLINFGGAYDRDTMREKAEIIYRYGSDVKHWFIGRKLWTVMMNADENFIRMNDKLTKRFGWQVYEYDFGHGLAILHTHPSFRFKDSTTTAYAYDAIIIDLEYVDLMVMNNMDLKVRRNVQNNDAHGQTHEIYGQIGLYRAFPSAHAYIYGITG